MYPIPCRSSVFRHSSLLVLFVAMSIGSSQWCIAQEKLPETKKPDEKVEFAEFLEDAKAYTIKTSEKDASLKLIEMPVLNFTNPERNQERGSVFIWLHNERPAVMGQFFRFDNNVRRLKKHALHLLTNEPLEAKLNSRLAWTPEQNGVEWKSFLDSPNVATKHLERQLQMRQLAKRFQLKLIDPKDEKTDLRLAPRPLYEYAAPLEKITDAAIFSFVVATDPEAILLIEAFEERGKASYRYAFARFHFWRLTATLNEKTVWDVEFDAAMPRNTLGQADTIKRIYNSYLTN
jgi:hypothetical protein